MGRGPSVTREEYGYIKQLLSQGLKTEQICERTKRSPDTIRCVDYSSDYDDFYSTPTKVLRQRRKNNMQQIKVDDICELEASEKEEEQSFERNHDLAAAYAFLRDECEDVKFSTDHEHFMFRKLLTVTMEVKKWESLF